MSRADRAPPNRPPFDPTNLAQILHYIQRVADEQHPGHWGGQFVVHTWYGDVVFPIIPADASGWAITPGPPVTPPAAPPPPPPRPTPPPPAEPAPEPRAEGWEKTERTILRVLKTADPVEVLTGPRVAALAGHPFDPKFTSVLSAMVHAGTLVNNNPGYQLASRPDDDGPRIGAPVSEPMQAVLDALTAAGPGAVLTEADLARSTGGRGRQLRAMLAAMVRRGLIEQPADGCGFRLPTGRA